MKHREKVEKAAQIRRDKGRDTKLRRRMEALGLTYTAIAKEVGLSASMVSLIIQQKDRHGEPLPDGWGTESEQKVLDLLDEIEDGEINLEEDYDNEVDEMKSTSYVSSPRLKAQLDKRFDAELVRADFMPREFGEITTVWHQDSRLGRLHLMVPIEGEALEGLDSVTVTYRSGDENVSVTVRIE